MWGPRFFFWVVKGGGIFFSVGKRGSRIFLVSGGGINKTHVYEDCDDMVNLCVYHV